MGGHESLALARASALELLCAGHYFLLAGPVLAAVGFATFYLFLPLAFVSVAVFLTKTTGLCCHSWPIPISFSTSSSSV